MSRRVSRDTGPGTLRPAGSHVTVPGGRLWTGQAGSGLAVLCAHAGIGDSRTWDMQMTGRPTAEEDPLRRPA